MEISIDIQGSQELEAAFSKLSKRSLKIAQREALVTAGFETQKLSKKVIKKKMITRNKWILGSVQVQKTPKGSLVGSVNDALLLQEEGGRKKSVGGKKARITTSSATREGKSAKPRKKVAVGRNRIANIHGLSSSPLARRGNKLGKPTSKKQENWLRIRVAIKTGKRLVYASPKGPKKKKGIFRVTGGNSSNAFKRGKIGKIKLIHDMTSKSHRIHSRPWLWPASKLVAKRIPKFYRKALEYQLRRL